MSLMFGLLSLLMRPLIDLRVVSQTALWCSDDEGMCAAAVCRCGGM